MKEIHMGSSVRAKCECGYDEEFLIGGGMETFETHCLFPCHCRDCKGIVSANLLQKPLNCPECEGPAIMAYDHDDLRQMKGQKEVASWNLKGLKELKLTDGAYYCPLCHSFRLSFEDAGLCWD
jgi:Zn finger protein HypA/HybF involved in hydrogenase expression